MADFIRVPSVLAIKSGCHSWQWQRGYQEERVMGFQGLQWVCYATEQHYEKVQRSGLKRQGGYFTMTRLTASLL